MRVARASKPRNAIVAAPTAVFEPFSLLETGTPFAFATGRLRRSSSVLRSPDLLIRSRVTFSTGFGPTSAAVGMADPVTKTRSVLASVAGARTASCANALDAMPRGTPTARVIRQNPNFTNPILIIVSPWFSQGLTNNAGGVQDLFWIILHGPLAQLAPRS